MTKLKNELNSFLKRSLSFKKFIEDKIITTKQMQHNRSYASLKIPLRGLMLKLSVPILLPTQHIFN